MILKIYDPQSSAWVIYDEIEEINFTKESTKVYFFQKAVKGFRLNESYMTEDGIVFTIKKVWTNNEIADVLNVDRFMIKMINLNFKDNRLFVSRILFRQKSGKEYVILYLNEETKGYVLNDNGKTIEHI